MKKSTALTSRYTLISKIAGDVCSALFHAHSNGSFIATLNRENILFDKNGDAVLTDFGIAHTEAGAESYKTGHCYWNSSVYEP